MPKPPEAAYGRRDSILALRTLAKTLPRVRGRKTLILLTDGLPLNRELREEASTTIDMLNRSNVAVYLVDIRGLAESRQRICARAVF